jgi:hypothetical protein
MSKRSTLLRVCLVGWALIVLLIAAGWFASWYVSFDRRFTRSKSALEALAAEVMATDPATPLVLPPTVGDFSASNAERLPHGFLFRCDYDNPFDWNGIAYSTEPLTDELVRPDHGSGDDGLNHTTFFRHVEGNWYKAFRN